jgi:hypothetical protein
MEYLFDSPMPHCYDQCTHALSSVYFYGRASVCLPPRGMSSHVKPRDFSWCSGNSGSLQGDTFRKHPHAVERAKYTNARSDRDPRTANTNHGSGA